MGPRDLPVHSQVDSGIRVLEEERRRIARDLHDGPAQTLTHISMRLDVINRLIDSNVTMAKEDLIRTNSKLVGAINDIRRLIYDLRPVAIDEIGLVAALAELLNRCQQEWRIPFEVNLPEGMDHDIGPAKQVALYRLVQEVTNNMKKHAEASKISVSMERTTSQLRIVISDDGKGFDPEQIPTGHYGLIGMRERAEFLGGTLDISSKIGHGSTFTICVPLNLEGDDRVDVGGDPKSGNRAGLK